MPPEYPSAEEVFRRLVYGVAAQKGEALAELYAEDAIVEHPLDPDGSPALHGRDALRQHFRQTGREQNALRLRPVDINVHQTTDPEVVVAEFAYEVVDSSQRVHVRVPGIFVMRIRGGLIVESRDYLPPPPSELG